MAAQKILLVEGPDDRGFFVAFCNSAGLQHVDIEPRTPSEFEATSGGWTNLIKVLPIRLENLRDADGDIEQLAVVIDCDSVPEGGFAKRFSAIENILRQHHYDSFTALPKGGFLFQHNDGLRPVGLWVMPNNQDDGMLESFIESLIKNAVQTSLMQHAKHSLASIPHKLFKPIHETKARIATWRSWQKVPGCPPAQAVKDSALDLNCTEALAFKNWLQKVFK